MTQQEIKIGKWYLIRQYGSKKYIRGKVVEVIEDCAVMKFYWGGLYRTFHVVDINELIGECKRPSLFSNH